MSQKLPRGLLYVDISNYASFFFPYGRKWNLKLALRNTKRWVKACSKANWTVVAFLDQNILTDEAERKWRSRREQEVISGKRMVPQGCLRLIGDMLMECGVNVRYSIEADNDDTIASWAQHDGASVVSADRDFLRYRNSTFDLYSGFELDCNNNNNDNGGQGKRKNDRIVLHRQTATRKSSWRDILQPPPLTGPCNPFRECFDKGTYTRGNPSPLSQLGNLHIHVRPLRQALYHALGIRQVEEEFPILVAGHNQQLTGDKSRKKRCIWDKQIVTPDQSCMELLQSPARAIEHFTMARPPPSGEYKITNHVWYQHEFALRAVIAELCCTYSGRTLFQTLQPLLREMTTKTVADARTNASAVVPVPVPPPPPPPLPPKATRQTKANGKSKKKN